MDIDEKLISLVKHHECLYNVNSRKYSDKNSKQNAWDEISLEMGISIQQCIIKWKRLRDNFRKALKTREKSESAAAKRRPLKYEWDLEFLKPYVKYYDEIRNSSFMANNENAAATESSGTAESYANQEMYSDEIALDFDEITTAPPIKIEPMSVVSTSIPHSAPSSSRDVTPTVEDILQNYLEAKAKQEKDPIDTFFLAMAALVKRLPQRVQLEVKQKVFYAVNDAELKVLNQGH